MRDSQTQYLNVLGEEMASPSLVYSCFKINVMIQPNDAPPH
jgi:hypothetical protein